MKKTFGQIVREKRKSLQLSQAELGEKIGVSVQTISRWECDGGMPDISQIVPLAKVLGTTTDMLLGMETSEEEAVEAVFSEVRDLWNNAKINNAVIGTRACDYHKTAYVILREAVRKYPTNLKLLESCTKEGVRYLKDIVVHRFFEVPEKEIHNMYIELERMINTKLNFESDLNNKEAAKYLLASLYSIMGNKERAMAEAEELSPEMKYYTQIRVAMNMSDCDERLLAAKKMFYHSAKELLFAFDHLSGAYAALGDAGRENAIKIFKKFSEATDFLENCLDDELINYYRIWINKCITIQYIRAGEFDTALDYIEKMTDNCVRFWEICLKECDENGTIPLYIDIEKVQNSTYLTTCSRDELRTWFECKLIESWGELGDKENNPIVTSDRYNKCFERVRSLKAE